MSEEKSEKNSTEKEMTFFEHLEEMRWVIFKCLFTLVITCASLCFFFPYLNAFLMGPLNTAKEMLGADIEVRISSITSPIFIILYMIFLGGFAISLPIMAYFIASFISPALNKAEKATLIPGVLAAIVLFFLGALMTYFIILPLGIYFSTGLATDILQTTMLLDAEVYYSFVCLCILGIGLAFELPLLEVILIYLGILNVETLKKSRRWVILILVIIAAVITPPDFVTQLTLAMPLYVLFELALIVGETLRKRKEKKEKEQEEAEEAEEREEARLAAIERKNKALLGLDNADTDDEFEQLEKEANEDEFSSKYAKYYKVDESYELENYGEDLYEDYLAEKEAIDSLEPKWDLNVPNLEPKWNLNQKAEESSKTSEDEESS